MVSFWFPALPFGSCQQEHSSGAGEGHPWSGWARGAMLVMTDQERQVCSPPVVGKGGGDGTR